MNESDGLKMLPPRAADDLDQAAGKLPYRVDLWTADRRKVEQVLARVASASLAQAIFRSATVEHPERYITLRRGRRVLAQTD